MTLWTFDLKMLDLIFADCEKGKNNLNEKIGKINSTHAFLVGIFKLLQQVRPSIWTRLCIWVTKKLCQDRSSGKQHQKDSLGRILQLMSAADKQRDCCRCVHSAIGIFGAVDFCFNRVGR